MGKFKYLFRLLAVPFFFGLQFVYAIFILLKNSYLFILHGGEWIEYRNYDANKIADSLDKILKQTPNP